MSNPAKKQNTLALIKHYLCLDGHGPGYSWHFRINLITNLAAITGAIGAFAIYLQLLQWGVSPLLTAAHVAIIITASSICVLNYLGRFVMARVVTVVLMNLAAWNALIFYGKSFNGYYFFFVAMIFSIIAFHGRNAKARWGTLLLSLTGLPCADWLTHKGLVPVTGFHSSQAPLSLTMTDTITVSFFIVAILLIEKALSERNESELSALNKNLESIVHKRTELLDIAREEAMAASRAKSQFIANTSHELRTPLGAIIGFVDLILDANPSEREKREYLEVVRRNANQLLQIVNDVLDLSKIEADKLQIDNEVFKLRELIEDVRSLITLKAEDKGLMFDVEIDESRAALPERVYADPLRLKQILINLIGNAIKFTSHGQVRLKVEFLDHKTGGQFLQFDISDTGPGISENNRQHLFQPFSQGDNTLMRRFGGTGLGLSLSKRLAKLLGGDLILLASEPGRGSVFRITVACSTAPEILDGKKKPLVAGNGKSVVRLDDKKILIVDDSLDNQRLVSQFLVLAGATVDVADNGEKALAMIEKHPDYNAVLMDLQMPVLDGYEATRILRERGVKLPIIAFTAHAMKDELNRSKSSGFTTYLTKPIQRQKLISTLAETST